MSTTDLFDSLPEGLPRARAGSMFGYPSLNIGRKPFAFWNADTNGHAAFKLPADLREDLLLRDGFDLFDPAGKGRPMKAWVQVSVSRAGEWPALARAAYEKLLLDELD